MPQGYIDIPLTTRQRQPATPPPPVASAAFEDVPLGGPQMNTAWVNGQRVPVESHVKDFASEVGTAINPIEWAKGLYGMATDLVGTAKGMGATHQRIYEEGVQAFGAGDYITAGRKFTAYLLPIVGPIADRAADLTAEGKYGASAGAVVGVGLQAAIPGALSKVRSVRIPVAPPNVNAAERAAVDFGLREGVPVDAATATGNRFVRGAQKLADESLLGSVGGAKARQAQADSLATVGERLATRTSPTPIVAEQAGQGVRDAVGARAAGQHVEAGVAYDKLRGFERQQAARIAQTGGVKAPVTSAKPFTDVPLAVDSGAAKAALRPIYDGLLRKKELVGTLMGHEARALVSLDALMRAPDLAPLSLVDDALGDLKSLSRVDQAWQRTAGQGIAAEAVKNLDKAVVTAAKQGGPDVFKALMDGRAATVNKYKAIEVFDVLRDEPVKVFQQLTANKDSAVDLLRRVQREAPTELPKLGRAYLEGLMDKATAEGGFGRTDGLVRDWQNLGTETKRLLFRNPALVKDLDSFFLLAKKIAENPNPSGTAFTLMKTGEASLLINNPAWGVPVSISAAGLSKLLHSRAAVRAMVRGLRMPVGNLAGASAAAAELASAARANGVPLAPAAAQRESAR